MVFNMFSAFERYFLGECIYNIQQKYIIKKREWTIFSSVTPDF
jgi:hypothetical protein